MLRRLSRHAKIFGYCSAMASTPACSIYDSDLLAAAKGGSSALEEDPRGSGGSSKADQSGGTENGGTGGRASGGDRGDVSMGGAGSDAPTDATGGAESCPSGDCCPDDPKKKTPGDCGCGEADDDRDGDLTADCHDSCPDAATKIEPGDCGCSVSAFDETMCSTLKQGIIHRYSFEGTGAEIIDSVGARHGQIVNDGVQSGGMLKLDGTDQYVSLPAGMISSLTSATFELWFTWNGGGEYQRIFDFGNSLGDPPAGVTYLYLAASKKGEGPGSGFALTGKTLVATSSTLLLDIGVQSHLVLVVDQVGKTLALYRDGEFQSGLAFKNTLSEIDDVYGYLGRSLFSGDPYLNGSIDELRIYDVALSQSEVSYSYEQGHDAALFD